MLQNDIFFCDWVCHRFRILRIWVSCMKIAALDCLNPWFPALESANRIPAMANHTMAMANHTLPCLIDDGTVCQGRAVTGLLPVWAVVCVCVFGCMFGYMCVCVRRVSVCVSAYVRCWLGVHWLKWLRRALFGKICMFVCERVCVLWVWRAGNYEFLVLFASLNLPPKSLNE